MTTELADQPQTVAELQAQMVERIRAHRAVISAIMDDYYTRHAARVAAREAAAADTDKEQE